MAKISDKTLERIRRGLKKYARDHQLPEHEIEIESVSIKDGIGTRLLYRRPGAQPCAAEENGMAPCDADHLARGVACLVCDPRPMGAR